MLLSAFSSLLTSTESAAEKELYNSLIGHNNKLLLNLINDVIDLSKIESGYLELRPDWVNLTELLDESVAEYAHQVPSGVELLTNYPAHDSLVELDKLRIKQILSNFLSNALKNTTTGHVEVFYEVDHQSVRIGVKDTGRGIPQNMLEKIFERFEKLDSLCSRGRSGLTYLQTDRREDERADISRFPTGDRYYYNRITVSLYACRISICEEY